MSLAHHFPALFATLLFTPTLVPAADPLDGYRLRLDRHRTPAPAPIAKSKAEPLPQLPPLPDGVTELKFADFFKTPVGPRGLELTETLRALDGQRVRVLGYMVIEAVGTCNADPRIAGKKPSASWFEASVPGRMLLTPTPQTVNFAHYGLCESLPPQTIYVTVPEYFGQPIPYTPGLMLLTGRLEVSQKTETDGRTSIVRLTLDEPAPLSPAPALAGAPAPTASTDTTKTK